MMVPYCILSSSTAQSAFPNAFCAGHFLCVPSRVTICYVCHREVQQFLHSLTAKNKDFGKVFVPFLACSALEPTPDSIWDLISCVQE